MALLPPPDTPSMLIMSIVAAAAMALAMAVLRQQRPEGLGRWALALVAYALACVFVLVRPHLPGTPGILTSNVLLTVALALLLGAMAEFQAQPQPHLRMAIPIVAVAALTLALHDSYHALLVITSSIWAAQLALIIRALWRPEAPEQRRGALLISSALGFQCLLLLTQALWYLTHPLPETDFLHGDSSGRLALIVSHAVLVLASLGFVLLTKDRGDAVNRLWVSNDALTGIANQHLLMQTLSRDVSRAVRQHEPYAVLMVDIDHFKAINDRLGHLGGDVVLCHIAHLLQTHVRHQDLVGRWGGEEFLVLLPQTSATGAQILAEKLRQLVERTPCAYKDEAIRATVSIGRCAEELEPGDESSHLIEAADKGLYAAKRAGGNRVESASLERMHALHGALAAPAKMR